MLFLCAGDRTAEAIAILDGLEDPIANAVKELEERRARLQQERLEVKKALKSETRKRQRLLSKAKGLSTGDLLNIVVMKTKAQTKAKAKATPPR